MRTTDKKTIVSRLVLRTPSRGTSDVGKWRSALRAADMGRTKLLYELYDDLLIDGRLTDAYEKRIQAVTNTTLHFVDASGKEVDAIRDLMDTPAFEELLTIIMDRLFYGRSGAELDFSNGFEVYEIPKQHIDLKGKQILINDTDEKGIPYEDDPSLMILGKPKTFGLFLKTAPFVIFKRGGFGDYAQWLEIFGMPQRIGKYSAYDDASRKTLEEALEKGGAAPWLVVPKETDIETVNNTGNGSSGQSYDEFRKACNEEMTITILGQTLTTTQGDKGARSLGEVHKQVEEGKNRADMRYVQRVLNKYFLPILEKHGFSINGGRFMYPDEVESLSVDEIISLSEVIDIPADYIYTKYSIPTPKGEETIASKKKTTEPIPPTPPTPPTPDPNKGQGKKKDDEGVGKEAKLADRNIFMRLWDFFVNAPAGVGATKTGTRLTLADNDDDEEITINDVEEAIINDIDGTTSYSQLLFEHISKDLLDALNIDKLNLADVDIQYGYESDAYLSAMEQNVYRFSAAKSLAEITELNKIYRSATSFEDFYQQAQKVVNTFNKTWQKTEYETANLIASSTSNYQRLIKKIKLFPYWEYRTVGDDKVRPEHAKLHGIILPYDDPRWQKIWPPNGWKCRCYIVPRMAEEVEGVDFDTMRARVDEFFETAEWKTSRASGFGVNRALSPEVFNENQQYIRKFPTRASKLLSDINYRTFSLPNETAMMKAATNGMPAYAGTLDSWLKGLTTQGDKTLLKDYLGRSVVIEQATARKSAAEALSGLQETLTHPDEVWIPCKDNKLDKRVLVRFYSDGALVVITKITNQATYTVQSLRLMATGGSNTMRAGLLIYHKDAEP